MDNGSVIFTGADTLLLKRYRKRILTAQVLIFSFAAISFLAAIIGIYFGIDHRTESDFFNEGQIMGATGLVFLVLAVLSIRHPFIPILLVAIIVAICLVLVVPDMLKTSAVTYNSIFILLQCTFIYFLARGVVYARKHRYLLKTAKQ